MSCGEQRARSPDSVDPPFPWPGPCETRVEVNGTPVAQIVLVRDEQSRLIERRAEALIDHPIPFFLHTLDYDPEGRLVHSRVEEGMEPALAGAVETTWAFDDVGCQTERRWAQVWPATDMESSSTSALTTCDDQGRPIESELASPSLYSGTRRWQLTEEGYVVDESIHYSGDRLDREWQVQRQWTVEWDGRQRPRSIEVIKDASCAARLNVRWSRFDQPEEVTIEGCLSAFDAAPGQTEGRLVLRWDDQGTLISRRQFDAGGALTNTWQRRLSTSGFAISERRWSKAHFDDPSSTTKFQLDTQGNVISETHHHVRPDSVLAPYTVTLHHTYECWTGHEPESLPLHPRLSGIETDLDHRLWRRASLQTRWTPWRLIHEADDDAVLSARIHGRWSRSAHAFLNEP